jgi:hypothetical protein
MSCYVNRLLELQNYFQSRATSVVKAVGGCGDCRTWSQHVAHCDQALPIDRLQNRAGLLLRMLIGLVGSKSLAVS